MNDEIKYSEMQKAYLAMHELYGNHLTVLGLEFFCEVVKDLNPSHVTYGIKKATRSCLDLPAITQILMYADLFDE